MTRLSATATIAALLLLAIAQGFGATKVTAKAATKGTAKPYHITAQNQFHFKSAKPSKAQARLQSQKNARLQTMQNVFKQGKESGPGHVPPAVGALSAAQRRSLGARAVKAHPHQANPPVGKIGFVSATQIPAGGGGPTELAMGTFGGATGFITVVYDPVSAAYNYSVVTSSAAPALTLVPFGDTSPYFIVGDVDGDGNSDLVQADLSGGVVTITVLLGSATGTFTAVTTGIGAPSPFTLAPANGATGGALVMNATSGFLDLVLVDDNLFYNALPSNIAVYAGNGDGTFGAAGVVTPVVAASSTALIPPTDPVLGALAGDGYNVIIADLDGDGTVDVAENDDNTGQLAVYLSSATVPYTGLESNTPDGAYDACTATAGSLTGSMAIVDVNCNDQTVTVYNNDGTGVFSDGVYYPVAGTVPSNLVFPTAATIADVNGDGNGDVVVVNDYTSDVTILVGNGDGTLQMANVGYALGGFPGDNGTPAIVTDLNGDGFADILVADEEYSLTWIAGFGDGTFQSARNYYGAVPGGALTGGVGIASGDFNGDGFADVVVGNESNGTLVGITVFLSNPDGSLQPGVNYGTGANLLYVTVGDFNGDGNLDIAASDYNGVVEIFSGTGNGNFVQGLSYSIGGIGQEGIIAATFGTDPAPDLAVLNANSSTVTILTNNGIGGFSAGVPITLNAFGYQLAAADLDGDGNPDLAIAESGGNQVGVLIWDSTTSLFDNPEVDVLVPGSPYGIALADVDGDTFTDIVATADAGAGVTGIAVALNSATTPGTFTPFAALLPASTQLTFWDSPFPDGIQITDVDGDGVADLVYTNIDYGTVGVLFGTGTGTATTAYFFDPVEFPTSREAYNVTVADLDGDGTADAANSGYFLAGAGVLINANGSAAAPNYSLSVNPGSVNITDGGTGTATITLTPVNFYNGTVTFSCTGLALKMTCTFAPASLTPAGNFSLSTTVTITTKAPHGALRMPADPHQGRTSLVACLTGMGLFGLLLAGDWKNKRNRRVGILLGILVLGMMFSLVGCSSSTPGTPIGAQSVTITATGSDGVNNAANLTVNVF
jgi:hypothetical protein